MKLFVVGDDAKIDTSLKRGLEAEGFAVEIASNGADGLWLATTRDVIQTPRRHHRRGPRVRPRDPLPGDAAPGGCVPWSGS